MDNEPIKIEIIDRYTCLGIPYPDPETMCLGPCEGTGIVPIWMGDKDEPYCEGLYEDDPVYQQLWQEAEEKEHAADGWHFVVCQDCHGTRLRRQDEA